jgi:hypothetical protein
MLIANPILAFIVDFAGSGLITTFTGVASYVGIANMVLALTLIQPEERIFSHTFPNLPYNIPL